MHKYNLSCLTAFYSALVIAVHLSPPSLAYAQTPSPQTTPEEFDVYSDTDEIVVVGTKKDGFSETDRVVPDTVFTSRDIQALGAADIGELLDALSAETQSTSDEPPILLLDGRRVASRREITRFPSEAVRQIKVLPPEAALKFTSDPSRRVLNFQLRPRFNAVTANAKARTTTDGGAAFTSLGLSTLKIKNKVRFASNASFETSNSLTQAQRDIPARNSGGPFSFGGTITAPNQTDEIDPALSSLAGQNVIISAVPDAARLGPVPLEAFLVGAGQFVDIDPQEFRDLKPLTETLSLGGSLFRPFGDRLSASGSIDAEFYTAESQSGLVGSRLNIDPDNPFTPFEQTISLYQYSGPIKRKTSKNDIETNLALYGDYQDWRWSLEGQYQYITNTLSSQRNGGTQSLQQRLDQNDPMLNPFGTLTILEDAQSDRTENNFLVKLGLSGIIATLPAGNVTGSARLDYTDSTLDSLEMDNDRRAEDTLSRRTLQMSSEINIPLFGKPGKARAGKKLSLRINGAVRAIDGFDALSIYGAGLNWNPTNKLQIEGGLDFQDRAPRLTQLGSPILFDSNVRVTDFKTGESVFIDRITGGNPDLDAEQRQSLQLTARYRYNRNVSFSTRYRARTTDNAISSFPFLTPQVAGAFPDRLLRDSFGNLISLDARPVNAFRTDEASLRSGINLKKRFKARPETKWPADQVSLSLHHTWRLKDKFQFRSTGPVFDLLGGAALRRQGGEPRHELQARFNFRRKNYGGTLYGTFETGTRIDVSSLPGNQGSNGDLNLNALAKADLQFYYDLGRQANGRKVKRKNWRRDLRLSLDIKNITNSKQFAVNGLGDVPFGYEQDALDPYGRTVMISLRKAYYK